MLTAVNAARLNVTPAKLAQRKFPKELISAVLDEDTGEFIGYRRLKKNPKYWQLYRNPYAKEIGWLAQGMPGLVEGNNTMEFHIEDRFTRWQV